MLQKETHLGHEPKAELAPTVSVIIPAYNVSLYIQETLDSVFAQTYTHYEVIVINDGSPDTVELEQALSPYRGRIVYLQQPNCGAAAARNTGLRAAQGQYIAFLDGDDYWLPNYLEEQLELMRNSVGYDLVFCDALLVGDPQLEGRTFMEMSPSCREVTFLNLLSLQCSVVMSGVIARKQAIFDVGLLDEQLRNSHDFDLWLRLARSGVGLTSQKKVLLHHRCRTDSLSGDSINRAERVLRVLGKVGGYHDLTAPEQLALAESIKNMQAVLELEKGKYCFTQGSFVEALEHLHKANVVKRSWKLRAVIVFLQAAPRLLLKLHQQRAERTMIAAQ
ncbi:MAG: glycosyltransferase family 2 protein [Pyrinomonadaceae bacterium]